MGSQQRRDEAARVVGVCDHVAPTEGETVTSTPLQIARELHEPLDRAARATPTGDPVPASSLELIRDAGLLGLMVPKEAGGLELPLADIIDVYAEIARADGSLGWCYFAADLTAAYFGAYLDDAGCAELFGDGVPLMAGQFAPNGTAVPNGDGWVVDGNYQFGSGIAYATWAGGGVLTLPDDGTDSEYLFACFPVDDVELKGNWDVLGLQGTGSYDYAIHSVRVPARRTFNFFTPTIHRGGSIYQLGVIGLTAAGHAGWALGVTRRILDELAAMARGTTRMGASSSLAESERFLFEYGALEGRYRADEAWVRQVLEQAQLDPGTGAMDDVSTNLVREACRAVNQGGADIARDAYLLAGTRALRDGPIQQCFRDLHAGSQHFFAGPAAAIDLARSLLAE